MNEHIKPKAFFPDYTGLLGDLRSERRGKELWNKLSQHPSSTKNCKTVTTRLTAFSVSI
jgi:hypothetical protein